MAAALPTPQDCCTTCTTPVTTNVPGAQGTPGTNGTDGTDGLNAFTTIAGDGTINVPAFGAASLALPVTDPPGSAWMGLNQVVYVEGYGYFQVSELTSGASIKLYNLGYTGNNAGVGNFAVGTKIQPGGLQGPTGTLSGAAGGDLTGSYPNPTLVNTGTAGVYGSATKSPQITTDAQGRVTGVTEVTITQPTALPPNGAAGGDLSGAYPDPVLAASGVAAATYGSNVKIPVLTIDAKGRVTTASSSTPRVGLLGYAVVNLDNGGSAPWDQDITMYSTRCIIRRVIFSDASADLTGTAFRCGIYTGAGATGNAVVATPFDPGALSATTKWLDATLSSYAGTDVIVPLAGVLKFYGAIEHGTAGKTMKVWIEGEDLS